MELLGQKSSGGQGQALLKEGQGKEKKQGVDEECDGGRVFGRGACIFVVGHRRRPWGPSGGGGWGRASFRGGASSHGSGGSQVTLKFYENLASHHRTHSLEEPVKRVQSNLRAFAYRVHVVDGYTNFFFRYFIF